MYPSDLSDNQWQIIEPLLPKINELGRPRMYDRRDLLNGILYVVKTGCHWRCIPHDFPHWKSNYHYFRQLSLNKIWEDINTALRKIVRKFAGREEEPSLSSIDSQSVKGDVNLDEKGIDGHKMVNGRKRHIAVDVMGLILYCIVTSANTADITAGRTIAQKLSKNESHPRMEKIVADSAYKGLVESAGDLDVEISVKDPKLKGFVPIRHRWVVERSFAWLYRQRRLVRDYEKNPKHQKSMVFLGMMKIMLNKLS